MFSSWSSVSFNDFINAAKTGNLATVQKYISENQNNVVNINTANNNNGDTALICAARNDHAPIVNALLAVPGININTQGQNGDTALILAADRGYAPIVNALLAAPGININTQGQNGDTALICAAINGHAPIVNALLAVPGININTQGNNDGNTALIWATYQGHAPIVNALLAAGADPNIASNKATGNNTALNNTALMYSITKDRPAIAGTLIEAKGADLNLVNAEGDTVLMLAIRKKLHDIVVQLMSANVDTTITNKKGETAESLANNDLTLRDLFKGEDFYQQKLKAFFDAMEKEANKKHASPAAEQKTVQGLVDTSFCAASESIRFIQDHTHQIQNMEASKRIFFDFANLLTSLGIGCNKKAQDEFDKAAHQLLKIASIIGYKQARNIITHFNDLTLLNDDECHTNPISQVTTQSQLQPSVTGLDEEDSDLSSYSMPQTSSAPVFEAKLPAVHSPSNPLIVSSDTNQTTNEIQKNKMLDARAARFNFSRETTASNDNSLSATHSKDENLFAPKNKK